LGIYIQAIIDATKLGILSANGTLGADDRLNRIVTFLDSRQLSSNGEPYATYQTATGDPYGTDVQDAADAGALLVALSNLRVFRPDFTVTIDSIVYNRTNYVPFEQAVDALTKSTSLYDYYVANGFADFWPNPSSNVAATILNNIASAPTVSTYGVALPISDLSCEPVLLCVFNLAPNALVNGIANQLYLAQQARYNATGKFTAFTEGNTGLPNPSYIYEWVVDDDGSTWTINSVTGQENVSLTPIIYYKAAVGLLALNDTSYTESMASYLESMLPTPTSGYADGVDENGRVDKSVIDKTNGMIIEAALYAINSRNFPTTSPKPSADQPGMNAMENWVILAIIAGIVVVGFGLFVKILIGFKRGKSSKPQFTLNCSCAPLEHRYFFDPS
jgi:hypothetical protein